MNLPSKYTSASQLGKVFVWLSAAVIVAVVALYVSEVLQAKSMDPNSYNCLHDSMMKQICADPYGSSIGWTIIKFIFLGWFLWVPWAVVGLVLLGKHATTPKTKSKPHVSKTNPPSSRLQE